MFGLGEHWGEQLLTNNFRLILYISAKTQKPHLKVFTQSRIFYSKLSGYHHFPEEIQIVVQDTVAIPQKKYIGPALIFLESIGSVRYNRVLTYCNLIQRIRLLNFMKQK